MATEHQATLAESLPGLHLTLSALWPDAWDQGKDSQVCMAGSVSLPIPRSSLLHSHVLMSPLCLCLLGSLNASLWPVSLSPDRSLGLCLSRGVCLWLASLWMFGNDALGCPWWLSVHSGLPSAFIFVLSCLCIYFFLCVAE